jgi:hypothetical protein
MTPLSPARRDAEAFALAVDENRVDGAHGGVADRYSNLLTCVDVLRAQDIPAPRADFVADLRMRLMDAADTLLVPAEGRLAPVVPLRVPASTRRQRRISVAAAAFVVIGGTAGVAAASENALPGDPLYPIKRGIESAQVSLNSSDAGKGQDLLRQAGTRLGEIGGLIQSHDSGQIDSTLASFRSSATDGADLLFVDYQTNGNPEGIANLRVMLGSQLTKLDSLSADATANTKSAFSSARAVLGSLDQQASVLCGDCGNGGISDGFTTTSAPSLAQLLNATTTRSSAGAAQAQQNTDLANKANGVAQDTPTTPASDPISTPTPPANPPIGTPITVPTTPVPVRTQLGGLTSGVSTLLHAADGSPLAPLTGGVVDSTLDTLTKGLLGK